MIFGIGTDIIEVARIHREEEQVKWEEWKRKSEQERLEKLWAKANKVSRGQVDKIISDWSESRRIEAFFHDVTQSLQKTPGEDRKQISDRIEAIMHYVGRPDALAELKGWRSPTEIMASLDEPLPDSASTGDVPA